MGETTKLQDGQMKFQRFDARSNPSINLMIKSSQVGKLDETYFQYPRRHRVVPKRFSTPCFDDSLPRTRFTRVET